MGKHDNHLPMKNLNKNFKDRNATERDKKDVAAIQGRTTKRDAKKAVGRVTVRRNK